MITWSPKNADMAKAYGAMLRAAEAARETARRFGTPLAIWQDGKVVHVPPERIAVNEGGERDTTSEPSDR